VKFWDREKELADLKRYLQTEPNAILFVYGPKSSGKSTLLAKVAEDMGESYRFYWYDLRGKVISNYGDVLEVFFKERGWSKRFLEGLSKVLKFNVHVFELDVEELEKVLKKEYDAFEVMERELVGEAKRGRVPVIVFDEIQKLRDVYINGQRLLVSELFNFFVRITKVLHLAHVLVMTSDTFFIEEVYSSSALKNTSRYYLVDYFDDETALRILLDEGLPEEEARYVISRIGGVPWMMEEVVESEDPRATVEELYRDHRARLREFLGRVFEEGGKELQEKVKEVLKKMLEGEVVEIEGEDRKVVKKLVEAELLFYDPLEGSVRFQTKLDEKAARDLLT